jgi:hypothetical protein
MVIYYFDKYNYMHNSTRGLFKYYFMQRRYIGNPKLVFNNKMLQLPDEAV